MTRSQGKNDEVLVQPAQGDMRVTLAYDDSSPIRTIIPFSYCLRVRVKGEELSRHAWNGVLTDLGAAENMRRKNARRETREEEKKKKGSNSADQGRS